MGTRFQDCLQENCLFSRRHVHPTGMLLDVTFEVTSLPYHCCPLGCKSSHCTRLMALPVRNPIRFSHTKCNECIIREREGTLGVDQL